jgi:tetratricopeptide (TPR) repeat protein
MTGGKQKKKLLFFSNDFWHRSLLWSARTIEDSTKQTLYLGKAARACESSQRWRVWMEASQIRKGAEQERRALLQRALKDAPERQRVTVLVEAARQENTVQQSEKLLRKAVSESGGHWRAGLELARLLEEKGEKEEGEEVLKNALLAGPGIGRLWATLARFVESREKQSEAILAAGFRLVPRSGELWTERGRALARQGRWELVGGCFEKAIVFTPQYGDVFIEMARASLWRLLASRFGMYAQTPIANLDLEEVIRGWNTTEAENLCVLSNPNHGYLWDRYTEQLSWGCIPIEVFAKAKMDLISRLRFAKEGHSLREIVFF